MAHGPNRAGALVSLSRKQDITALVMSSLLFQKPSFQHFAVICGCAD